MNFRSINGILKDPKKKSLTILVIYIIFFIIVFALISTSPSPVILDSNKQDETDTKLSIDSYEYIYKITRQDDIIEIKGTLNKNEEIFTYNGLNYYRKDNVISIYEDGILKEITNLDFDIDKYKYNNIENLIQNSTFEEKVVYKDNSEKSTYNINIYDYFNLLNEEDKCDSISCEEILINIIVESKENIEKVSIDLTNYYNYNYTVEINYSNINNINEIDINNIS